MPWPVAPCGLAHFFDQDRLAARQHFQLPAAHPVLLKPYAHVTSFVTVGRRGALTPNLTVIKSEHRFSITGFYVEIVVGL